MRGSKRPPPDGLGLHREVRGPQQEGRCGAEWEAWKDTVLESPAESERAREPQRAQVPCRWEMCDFPDWVKPVGLAEWFLLAAWSWHQEADAWGLARCVLEDEAGRSLRVFEGSDSRASRGK